MMRTVIKLNGVEDSNLLKGFYSSTCFVAYKLEDEELKYDKIRINGVMYTVDSTNIEENKFIINLK